MDHYDLNDDDFDDAELNIDKFCPIVFSLVLEYCGRVANAVVRTYDANLTNVLIWFDDGFSEDVTTITFACKQQTIALAHAYMQMNMWFLTGGDTKHYLCPGDLEK